MEVNDARTVRRIQHPRDSRTIEAAEMSFRRRLVDVDTLKISFDIDKQGPGIIRGDLVMSSGDTRLGGERNYVIRDQTDPRLVIDLRPGQVTPPSLRHEPRLETLCLRRDSNRCYSDLLSN